MNKGKVIVGLSGGVDSSVAALLLIKQGWQVEGLFMKNWEEDDDAEYCAAAEDLKDAQQVADQLGIKLHTVNFASEYWDRVFSYFLEEYQAGRTPNPDILCNSEIKFKAFLDYALGLGADFIATGHYARVKHIAGKPSQLIQAEDNNKDQTYFLYRLNQHQLSHSLFPLGDINKSTVRDMARDAGFDNHRKKDSTGICFIGERRFKDFLSQYLPANPGDILTDKGVVIGQHQGLMYYTLGQRQGLGIGGVQGTENTPWFVAGKNMEHNQLIVVQGHDHPLLMCDYLVAEQLHNTQDEIFNGPITCMTRSRHRQPLQAADIRFDNDRCHVEFDQPQRAATPGQSIVFYQDGICLGGGIIESTGKRSS